MKLLREILLKDWKYKLMALAISFSLWSVVNFGSRTAITVTRYVELENTREGMVYRVKPERVDITVYVVERLILSKMIERVRAYVDLGGVEKPGIYKIKVRLETPLPILIHPAGVEPPVVKVIVNRS
ncbi:MAG: hypothetical protein Q9N34_04635 [Aquificota bacterium]|nr:hypothetical protein [Aquificota bacterium]